MILNARVKVRLMQILNPWDSRCNLATCWTLDQARRKPNDIAKAPSILRYRASCLPICYSHILLPTIQSMFYCLIVCKWGEPNLESLNGFLKISYIQVPIWNLRLLEFKALTLSAMPYCQLQESKVLQVLFTAVQ